MPRFLYPRGCKERAGDRAVNNIFDIPYYFAPEREFNIVGDEVDGDYEYFDWLSLKKRGVPENALFAVRFLSDIPIIISHPDHNPVYVAKDN